MKKCQYKGQTELKSISQKPKEEGVLKKVFLNKDAMLHLKGKAEIIYAFS